jgi:hypothetical protein
MHSTRTTLGGVHCREQGQRQIKAAGAKYDTNCHGRHPDEDLELSANPIVRDVSDVTVMPLV